MIHYFVITKTLHAVQPLDELITSKAEIVSKDIGGNKEDIQWIIGGFYRPFTIILERFSVLFNENPDRIQLLLNIEHDPYVVVFTKDAGSEPFMQDLTLAVADAFDGFIDFDGDIVSQIYPTRPVDEEGKEQEEKGKEYLGIEDFLKLVDFDKNRREYQAFVNSR